MFQKGTQSVAPLGAVCSFRWNHLQKSFHNKQVKDLPSGLVWENDSFLDTLFLLIKNCKVKAQGKGKLLHPCDPVDSPDTGLRPPGKLAGSCLLAVVMSSLCCGTLLC